jgi:hypothetical protein
MKLIGMMRGRQINNPKSGSTTVLRASGGAAAMSR